MKIFAIGTLVVDDMRTAMRSTPPLAGNQPVGFGYRLPAYQCT